MLSRAISFICLIVFSVVQSRSQAFVFYAHGGHGFYIDYDSWYKGFSSAVYEIGTFYQTTRKTCLGIATGQQFQDKYVSFQFGGIGKRYAVMMSIDLFPDRDFENSVPRKFGGGLKFFYRPLDRNISPMLGLKTGFTTRYLVPIELTMGVKYTPKCY